MALSPLAQALKNPINNAFAVVIKEGITQGNYVDNTGKLDPIAFKAAEAEANEKLKKISEGLAIQMADIIDMFIKSKQVTVVVPPGSINTQGSPAAQLGPLVPVQLKGTIL